MTALTRTKKDPKLSKEMSSRLNLAINECLDVSIEECSKILGYSNSSPLRKAMSGDSFVDTEKLISLATIKNEKGLSINLHWLITGEGSRFLGNNVNQKTELLAALLQTMPDEKLEVIMEMFDLKAS